MYNWIGGMSSKALILKRDLWSEGARLEDFALSQPAHILYPWVMAGHIIAMYGVLAVAKVRPRWSQPDERVLQVGRYPSGPPVRCVWII